jgi:hypothetical protein
MAVVLMSHLGFRRSRSTRGEAGGTTAGVLEQLNSC